MKLPTFEGKKWFYSALTICCGLYLAQFICLLKYAVNIPYWDEWEAINRGGVLAEPSFEHLLAQHNEHRIVTTKLLSLALYYLDGWNLITHQVANFLIYGILVASIAYIVKKSTPELSALTLMCFVVFMLSCVSIENHFWGFQSQFHFALLFSFLSVWFLFSENQGWLKTLLGTTFSLLAIYSFSSGLVASLVIIACYGLFKAIRIYRSTERLREVVQLSAVLLIISGAIYYYFVGYAKPELHPVFTFPYQKLFWTYLTNLLSGGFGFKIDNIAPGTFVFFFVLVPIIGLIKKYGSKLTPGNWVIIVSTLAIFAALSSITMGRAGFGKGHSKASRYSEIVIMLIPLSIALWSVFLVEQEKWKSRLLFGFWCFCFIGLIGYWNFPGAYQTVSAERQEARNCVQNYFQNGGAADCPGAYPRPIADRLDFIKDQSLSFVNELKKRPNADQK